MEGGGGGGNSEITMMSRASTRTEYAVGVPFFSFLITTLCTCRRCVIFVSSSRARRKSSCFTFMGHRFDPKAVLSRSKAQATRRAIKSLCVRFFWKRNNARPNEAN